MVRFTLRRLSLVTLVALVISVAADTARLIQAPVALAEERAQGTGLTLSSFVRVVDGKSIDAVIDGRRVAIAVHGIDTPQGNTSCGKQAADALKAATRAARTRGGVRLVDDPSDQFDSRGRKIFYLEDTSGRPLADDLVKAGVARANGKGKDKDRLRQADDDARGNRRGCLWTGGRQGEIHWPPADGPVVAMNDYAAAHDLALAEAAEAVRQGATIPHAAPALDQTRAQADDENPDTAMVKSAMIRAAQEQVNAVPTGFQDEMVVDGIGEPTALAFVPDGRVLVATKSGIVRVIKNGALLPTPFIDLQAKVNDYWDRGLLGIAVDPAFASNGYVYLSYVYENDANDYSGTKTSRVSRVTATGDIASPASEVPILGTQVGDSCYDFPVGADCLPTDFFGHSVGALKFAPDGTLFFAMGEGANWNVVNDDAMRAQDLNSLGGKIIRITTTGAGVAGNPYWNGDANANRSKVWAYGLRNPYRFNLKPGTSVPFLGDVGWSTWEEVNVASAGANLGWPCYEGAGRQSGYEPKPVCQTLYGQGASAVKPPLTAWNHNGASAAATGGTFYTGTAFPAQYQGAYFYADYALGFIKSLKVDANNALVGSPTDFGTASNPVAIEMAPDGTLWYVAVFTGEIRRIRYGAPAPPPPPPTGTQYVSDLTWISATNGWGPVEKDKSNGEDKGNDGSTITLNGTTYPKGLGAHAPSDVRYNLAGTCQRFFADVGVDDEMGSLGSIVFQVWLDGVKAWDSGTMNGTTATKPVGSASGLDVTGKQTIQLVITDAGNGNTSDHGDWANARLACGGTNTPPIATISAPTSTLKYKVGDTINFAGSATDAQDGALAPANLSWTIRLHHCPGGTCHTHQLLQQSGIASGSFVAPDEADDNKIELILTATDSAGLTGTASVMLLPQTVQVTITTNPAGYQVVYSGTPGTAPMTLTAIVGSQRTIQVTSPQNGATFTSWSDGGAQSHNITIPTTNTTYTASFSGGAPPSTTTYLSDMTWASASNGYGPVEKNKSNGEAGAGDGTTLTLNGVTYAKGLGTHAASDVRYTLPSNCTKLEAQVGVDDEVGTAGNVVFQVWLDGVKAWDSGTMTGATATKSVGSATGLDITGKTQLRLVVTVGAGGATSDHGDWADAKVTCGGAPPPPPPPPPPGTPQYLSDRTWTSATNGYGPVEKDLSNGEDAAGDGTTLTLNGVTYGKGLGTHAASDIRYNLAGQCTLFQAQVGVDDEVGNAGNVVFQVWLDGVKAWDSGNMTGATATKPVGSATGLNVTGKNELRLVVTVGSGGATSDHGDWADAKVTCS